MPLPVGQARLPPVLPPGALGGRWVGAGWALGPAWNMPRVLCPSTEGACVCVWGGAARRHKLPGPTGRFQFPAASPPLLSILKTKVCGFSEPSAVGYRNLKDGVLNVSSLMTFTVFYLS